MSDLDHRTPEEQQEYFEKHRDKFTSLGFSSLDNFYATIQGIQDPE